ncbi:hypothetical protein BD626DRAFT_465860 [Schizophyllum amplum]|uniref:DDE Tnp4 domain-containing protein n=1 Tax=Schizophyllum amplum TaxID=97359 RepID=A0A550BWA4_9AGAR|nr:hypothetical protein BD626DRAFT_465860 [Auriculariopsis ampla]
MGMLKGRWQSLRELRIQMKDKKRHLLAVLWIRVCIILHNIILRKEGDNFDAEWREELCTLAGDDRHSQEAEEELFAVSESSGEEEGNAAEVRRAERQTRTTGETFRRRLMDVLFDSPHTTARRR